MNILIVDDHAIVRKALINLLRSRFGEDASLVEAQNGIEAIEKIDSHNFDVVLLDIRMPKMGGWEVSRYIRSKYPDLAIIVLTQYDTDSVISHFEISNIRAFINKGSSIEELMTTIQDICISKPVSEGHQNAHEVKPVKANSTLNLSNQDRILIKLMIKGFTSKQIASEMNLTVRTVETYRERLLDKTGTCNVAQLISYCYEAGLLP